MHLETLLTMQGAESHRHQAFLMTRGLTAREARTVSRPERMRQVRYRLLQRLCEGLLCTPNDVFRWTGATGSHLEALNRPGVPNLAEQLRGVEDLNELQRLIDVARAALENEPVTPRVHDGRLFMNVRRFMELRSGDHMQKGLIAMGFSKGEASGLLSDDQKAFKLPMLTRVCVAFRCLPNDVLDFEGPERHVLAELKKPPVRPVPPLTEGLSEAQLRRVLLKIREAGAGG